MIVRRKLAGVVLVVSPSSQCWGWQPCRPIQCLNRGHPLPTCLHAVPPTCNNNNDDDKQLTGMENKDIVAKKPLQSRLALLAEDWLEEEDELSQYWERFEQKTAESNPNEMKDKEATQEDCTNLLTTEERLERYLDNRGIRREEEMAHRDKIEAAIQAAQNASTAEEALQSLEAIQPFLQVHTRLGGMALIEYLTALWQKDRILDEELCRALLKNPHHVVVSKVKRLLKSNNPPLRQPSFWSGLFSKDGTSGNGLWW